jgi:hypothetical protein
MDRNMAARARLFSPVIYERIARLASDFEMLNSHWNRSAIRSCIPFIGGGRAFAFAPALHHGRRTDIGAAGSAPQFWRMRFYGRFV